MKHSIDEADFAAQLAAAGVRPTRQRVLLAEALFGQGCRHVTADALFREVEAMGENISLATVYNTLHCFTAAGFLKEIAVEGGASYFDTNRTPHHHFLCEETGELRDIPADAIALDALPEPPAGSRIAGVEVIVRTRPEQ